MCWMAGTLCVALRVWVGLATRLLTRRSLLFCCIWAARYLYLGAYGLFETIRDLVAGQAEVERTSQFAVSKSL